MPWCPECGVEYREGFTQCSECRVGLVEKPPPRPAPQPIDGDVLPEPDWLTVGVFTTGEEARIARGFLAGVGIAAAVIDARTHDPELSVGVLDEWLVKVSPHDVSRAKDLLAEAERGGAVLAEEAGEPSEEPGGSSP